MKRNNPHHLTRDKQIQLGSYYTPKELVDIVYKFINPYFRRKTSNIVILDNAAGFGAFIMNEKGYDYRTADCDKKAVHHLQDHMDKGKVFFTNSLLNISRDKYKIPDNAFLIIVGNPPYNDTTSEFKNGEKGRNICDHDIYDRDKGISFLKSYNKLKADLVCVLHPLSYLIKEANFNRLKQFKNNYKLIKAIIFPSSLFSNTGSAKFPIMIGLYKRDKNGMNYDYIRHFKYSIINSKNTFVLSKYTTTDGYIDKYPPSKHDLKISPIGMYYYTFRDINSLKKNASFITIKHPNGIVVNINNIYKYAYLHAFKSLFKSQDSWLYGNLSPLMNKRMIERNKNMYIEYALKTNSVLRKTNRMITKKIAKHYKIDLKKPINLDKTSTKINDQLSSLIS